MLPDLTHLPRARELHATWPIIDAHADLLWRARTNVRHDFVKGASCHHLAHKDARKAGVRVIGAALYTEGEEHGPESTVQTDRMIDIAEDWAKRHPDRLTIICSQQDLFDITSAPTLSAQPATIGLILWIEGGSPLRGDIETSKRLIARGVRGLILTHNHDNEIGGACFGEGLKGVDASAIQHSGSTPTGRPLTDFGRDLIQLCEARGVAIDLSHASPRLFWDVVAIASKPLCVSHGGNFVVAPSPRNLDDEQLRAIAESGGVFGLDFYPGHIAAPGPDGRRRATVEDVAITVERLIDLIGEDHVAFGSDFDGYDSDCIGLETVAELPNLTATLLARGHSEARLRKLWFENWQRYLGETLPV